MPWEYPDFANYLRVVDPPIPKPFKWHSDRWPDSDLIRVSQQLGDISRRVRTAAQRLEKLSEEECTSGQTFKGWPWWKHFSQVLKPQDSAKKFWPVSTITRGTKVIESGA